MTLNQEPNIHCLAVKESVFDDCQAIVKTCFSDSQFNSEMSLGAVNSINWCRIVAQIVYYVHSAAQCSGAVSFVVPTGNFGNMLAGYACIARAAIATYFFPQILRSAAGRLHSYSQPCHRKQQQRHTAQLLCHRLLLGCCHHTHAVSVNGHFSQL